MNALWLNRGSGQRPFQKPWVNIDAQEKWKPDLVADAAHLPYEASSAAFVVDHHLWEHEGCGGALALQQEAFRVLRPGGRLLVFVPDLRALAQRWLMSQLDTQVYMTNLYGAYMGDEHDRHKWGYDHNSLAQELTRCDWAEIRPFDWRPIVGADLARAWWVLAYEAVR